MKPLSALTGKVRTFRPGSQNPYNILWSDVSRWEPSLTSAAQEFGVDEFLMPAMTVVESDANQYTTGKATGRREQVIYRDDGFGDGPSIGMLQPKPRIWQRLAPGVDAYTPDGNIVMGTAIMADAIEKHGTWQKALKKVYFPADDPNGTTQQEYVDTVTSLLAEMRNQLKDDPILIDPYFVIFGGKPYRVEYGFKDDVGLNYYAYGVGHGTQRRTQHTGDDVLVPDETPLYSPFAGKVTCVGWQGSPTWGQGCGYFEDVDGGGIGNISILADTGYKVVLGHSSRAFVTPGQRVAAGQKVGTSGSMNGPHTHVEVAVERNGTYWLLDPKPALIEAMGGVVTPPPPEYAPRIDAPQPTEYEGTMMVWVVREAAGGGVVPVMQSTVPGAPEVRHPLELDEEFTAAYPFIGQDHHLWWMSTTRSRIPYTGTRIVNGPTVGSPTTGTPIDLGGEVEAITKIMGELGDIAMALDEKG